MTIAAGSPSRRSPWLSVWLRPGDTIEQVLASERKRHVLLLTALYAVFLALSLSLGDPGRQTFDWSATAIMAVEGVTIGMAYVYILALALAGTGTIAGGDTSAAAMRAVLAWSLVPPLCGLACYLAVRISARLFGLATVPALTTPDPVTWTAAAVLVVWSWIITWRMVARVLGFGFWRTAVTIVSPVLALFLAAGVLGFRTFVIQPFSMPSGSMEPTLLVGDYFFVSKFRYGYSHYSLPFSPPLFSGRLFAAQPQRGDVVVFRLPKDDSIDYVKRLIGLPGERIQMIDGVLYINGRAVKREQVADLVDTGEARPFHVKRWRETLPNGVTYDTVQQFETTTLYDNTPPYQVPAGHFFMLGDNRQNSQDSRALAAVGYIPFENIIGRAEIIFLSVSHSERAGMIVQ